MLKHGDDECDHSHVNDHDQALSIGSVFIILGASMLGAGLPLLFKRFPRLLRWPFLVVIGKHIGTGVLLALAFIHLLVPAFEQLDSECLPAFWHTYPFAALFALAAALGMHLIETAVLDYTVYSKPGFGEQSYTESSSRPASPTKRTRTESPTDLLNDDAYDPPSPTPRSKSINSDNAQVRYHEAAAMKADLKAAHTHAQAAFYHNMDDAVVPISEEQMSKSQVHTHAHAHHDSHGHSHGILLSSDAERTVGAYILEFGLTSHSIIVGITLGVAGREEQMSLIPALAVHQFFEGFALGARLASVNFGGWNEAILTTVYSLSAPLGTAIGIGIVHSYHAGSTTALLVQGIFDSMSAGIILYVAFVQMLALEFPTDYKACGRNWMKKLGLFGGLYLGIAVMAVIGVWV